MTSAADSRYRARGVSAGKEDVHQAIAHMEQGLYPGAFCKILPDIMGGDSDQCLVLHADGAGTKSSLAYIAWQERGDLSVWRGIAQDSLIMNIDDCACVGAMGPFIISNTIGRNAKRIPGSIIAEIIAGYQDVCALLENEGIPCHIAGGETADVGDLVRTIIVDSTVACRMPRQQVIDAARMRAGDSIIGFASHGCARWEDHDNSGIGSNGLTGARHELLHKDYAHKYPESYAPEIDPSFVYSGPFHLDDPLPESMGMTIGDALLSPTRTFAPLIAQMLKRIGHEDIHGLIHCSGGALTKIGKFGSGNRYILDALPEIPPLFRAIQATADIAWREMLSVYNCGIRLKAVVPPDQVDACLQVARDCAIPAQVIGRVEDNSGPGNHVEIHSPHGTFTY
ncbi:MAG: phosphoribosylformylglycinamidine cyclo-ligase [Planctomycetota bacterium]|nr:MAG: phosphoribosylformylglycinamidine cyclo-ligase [Planctomycetota bacterium]